MLRNHIIFIVAILLIWAFFAFSSQIYLLSTVMRVIAVIILLACFILVIYVPMLYFREYQNSSAIALQKILKECEANKTQAKGTILITFYIYVGFLNTLKTIKVETMVDKEYALALLKKLRNFNFRWGLFGAGALFVPFSTMYNYIKQRQRILKASAQ